MTSLRYIFSILLLSVICVSANNIQSITVNKIERNITSRSGTPDYSWGKNNMTCSGRTAFEQTWNSSYSMTVEFHKPFFISCYNITGTFLIKEGGYLKKNIVTECWEKHPPHQCHIKLYVNSAGNNVLFTGALLGILSFTFRNIFY